MQSDRKSQLSQLVAGGIPLSDGLRAVAEDAVSRRDRRAFRRLAERLERGASVSDALGDERGLPVEIRELLQEGIRNGRLDRILEEYAHSLRESRSVWRSFYASLLYPVAMVCLALVLLLVFIGVAMPTFKEMFDDFGVQFSFLTYWMISVSEHLWLWGLLLVGAMVIFPGGLWLHQLLPGGGLRSRLFQYIPLIGRAQRMVAAAEFCSRLAVLVDCRIPLDRACEVLSTSLGDSHLREVSASLSRRLRAGTDPAHLAHGVPGMIPALSGAFRWSHDPELFADGLRSLSKLFGAQARVRVGQVSMFIEPLALIAIGGAAAIVAISCVNPLFRLLNHLS